MVKLPSNEERVVESIDAPDIGEHLKALSQQLEDIAQLTARFFPMLTRAETEDPELVEEAAAWEVDAIRRTLTGLSSYRREYARWERLIVEYALTRSNLTQREVAGLLGVGLSTVNRWNQHPITHDD